MAKIGLKNFRYSKLDENDQPTKPESLGKAVSCKVSVDNNEAELYADDSLAESDYTFKKGSVSLEVDDEGDTTFAELLGHSVAKEGDSVGEVIRNAKDQAPFVAMGRVLTKIVNGKYKYKVEILLKVKFKEPEADEATKGESVEFATNSIEGAVHQLANGDWSKAKNFDTYDEAQTYLIKSLTAPTMPSKANL